jgi:PIN domain nuclease of toxin-antitoxin system
MTGVVLDASAVLAYMLAEPGADVVESILRPSYLTAINLAEIVSYYAKFGAAREEIVALLQPMPCTIVAIDAALSFDAGMLRPLTLKGGLSLGDRYCLALARRLDLPALTAERHWPLIADAAGVRIELIR